MSAAERLEALISIENNLKQQYESKLNKAVSEATDRLKKVESLQATITKQVAKIAELSVGTADSKQIERTRRDLENKVEKLQAEIDKRKGRAKELKKENSVLRDEVKGLRHLDAGKIKKNLVEVKKKLQEKSKANDLLSKTSNEVKAENAKLARENEGLQTELDELKAKHEKDSVADSDASKDSEMAEVETIKAVDTDTVEDIIEESAA